jgi:hypothetical protein
LEKSESWYREKFTVHELPPVRGGTSESMKGVHQKRKVKTNQRLFNSWNWRKANHGIILNLENIILEQNMFQKQKQILNNIRSVRLKQTNVYLTSEGGFYSY